MKLPKGNTLFLIIATVVVAGGLYWYFFTGGSAASSLPLTTSSAPSSAQVRFETLTSELGPITFNLAILTDPRFTALVDLTTPVTPEPTGRTDPFAPVPGIPNTGQ